MRRRSSQRGATLVEAAIIAPVLFLVIFAFLDIGMYTRALEMGSNAVLTGSRTARASANDPAADYYILKSIKDSLAVATSGSINCVIIFHAATSTDSMSSCDGATCPGACNKYTATTLDHLSTSDAFVQHVPPLDQNWPAADRDVTRHCGTDMLGIFLQMKYTSITGMYKFPGTINKNFVAPLDPVTDEDFPANKQC